MSDRGAVDATEVRAREEGDLEGCAALTRAVHDADRYPLVLQSNIADFLAPSQLIVAWVAQRAGRVVGHVALHRPSPTPMASVIWDSLGIEPSRIGVVSRLMISPSVRREGVGRRLLETAATDGVRRGLTPALDVVTRYEAAISLYERAGWERIGRITVTMPDGHQVDEFVYVGPTSPRGGGASRPD